jgi:hypothetical protein
MSATTLPAVHGGTINRPNATSVGTIGAQSSATITILDDDLPPPVFTVVPVNASIAEGTAPGLGGDLQFVFTRTGDFSAPAPPHQKKKNLGESGFRNGRSGGVSRKRRFETFGDIHDSMTCDHF